MDQHGHLPRPLTTPNRPRRPSPRSTCAKLLPCGESYNTHRRHHHRRPRPPAPGGHPGHPSPAVPTPHPRQVRNPQHASARTAITIAIRPSRPPHLHQVRHEGALTAAHGVAWAAAAGCDAVHQPHPAAPTARQGRVPLNTPALTASANQSPVRVLGNRDRSSVQLQC